MIKAVYPGTFDPLTRGHEDLVRRASTLFATLIVGVADSRAKRTFFTLAERVAMAREVLGGEPRVEVVGFDGLLIDFVRRQGARVVLRGLRAVSDFEYELQMAMMNRRLAHDIETAFLMPSEAFSYVSSRLVREVARLGGDVGGLVPPSVARALHAKFGRDVRR